MKHPLSIIVFLLMISASKISLAQDSNDMAVNHSGSTVNPIAISPDKKKFKSKSATLNSNALKSFINSNRILKEAKSKNVNINAVRDFIRSYKNVEDAKWFKTEDGYVASFLSKGTFTKVVYDEKGRWLYNLLEYTEANMAFEIRHIVKRKYYDSDILVIHQYEFDNDKTVYIIRMQDQHSNIVTLKVYDGEIEDITPRKKN